MCTIFACTLFALVPKTVIIEGRNCIKPSLDELPKTVPLAWESDGGKYLQPASHREPMPRWLLPQFTWIQLRELPRLSVPIDITSSGNEVWLAYYDFIVRYDTLTKQIHVYEFEKEKIFINDILATKDQKVWVAGTHLLPQYAVLLRFDREEDKFIIAEDSNGVLNKPKSGSEARLPNPFERILRETTDGTLLFLFRDGIYSYDVLNNYVTVLFEDPNMRIASFEPDPRGWIWFTILDDNRVWLLRSRNTKPENFALPELYLGTNKLFGLYFADGFDLYLDSHNRVWIPYWAFLNSNEQDYYWKILPKNPLFVYLHDMDFVYDWDYIYTNLESMDGNMWFRTGNGVIRYNLETDTACLISPESGPIAEGPDGTIWILINNQLYRFDPNR